MSSLQKGNTLFFLSMAAVLAVYIATLLWLPADGVWICDDSIKRMQAQSLAANHFKDFALPVKGKAVDNDLAFSPIKPPFAVIKNGKIYPVFSAAFSLLNAFLYSLFGLWALRLLPLWASLWICFMASRIGALLGITKAGRALSVLIIGLATPVWFYSVLIWEHTVAAAFIMTAVYFCLRFFERRKTVDIIITGLMSGLAIYFRDELYLWCVVLFFSLFVYLRRERPWRSLMMLTGSVLVAVIPLWVFQYAYLGSPFGLHISSNVSGDTNFLSGRMRVFYSQILASGADSTQSVFFGSVFLVAVGIRLVKRQISMLLSIILTGAAVIGAAVFGCQLVCAGSVIGYLLQSSNAFMVSAPVIMLAAFGQKKEKPAIFWLFALTVAYMLAYALIAPQTGSQGIHWANRYILLVYPLFAILAGATIGQLLERPAEKTKQKKPEPGGRKLFIKIIVPMIIIESIALQGISLWMAKDELTFTSSLDKYVAGREEKIVVTPLWWVPPFLHTSFPDKMIFCIPGGQQVTDFFTTLQKKGYDRLLYVTAINDPAAPQSPIVLQDGRLNFFRLKFIPCVLRNNQWEMTH